MSLGATRIRARLNFQNRGRSRMQAACLCRWRGAEYASDILRSGVAPTGFGAATITIDSGTARGWLTAK